VAAWPSPNNLTLIVAKKIRYGFVETIQTIGQCFVDLLVELPLSIQARGDAHQTTEGLRIPRSSHLSVTLTTKASGPREHPLGALP
jgi:hypothetical protein